MHFDLWNTLWRRACLAAVVASVGVVATGAAQVRSDDKTILTFSEPVLIPGATLQPGTYVFQLAKSNANRHVVRITRQHDGEVMAMTQAVPMRRTDPRGDVVLKFSPTASGVPPAVKGWFYPGDVYGHEFIYPDSQARDIARRDKTVVLSVDVPGTDLQKGTLRVYNAEGVYTDWRGDEAMMAEWQEWHNKQATAPAMDTGFAAMRVDLGELEDHAARYIGKSVSVDAEIDRVHGPRLFTIDEPDWIDLEGELLVYLPSSHVAPVRKGDRVTVTGTVKRFAASDLEKEWGWKRLDSKVEADLASRPLIVATRIVGGNNDLAMKIVANPAPAQAHQAGRDTPVGTSGAVAGVPVTNVGAIAKGDTTKVGRKVDLTGVTIDRMTKGRGFTVRAANDTLFILPGEAVKTTLAAGDTVSITGVVLSMPDAIEERLDERWDASMNDDIYVFATTIEKSAKTKTQ